MLKLAPVATLTLLLGPVLAGLVAIVLPAFGFLPALGGESFHLQVWRGLLQAPGLGWSLWLSFSIGLITTLLSLLAVVLICAAFQGTRGFAFIRRLLAPLLSVPHVALALGLAFAIAPSGLVMRWLSPWANGLSRPPDLLIVNDPNGLALMAGLLLKEIPFLFLMTLAALPQADATRSLTVARTLGYGRIAAWLKAVFPRIYPQIRLPVLAVLAFSASVVDVALILGPSTPPPLAVQTLRWAQDPDLSLLFQASASGLLQCLVVLAAIAVWLLGEMTLRSLGRFWLARGGRRCAERSALTAATVVSLLVALVVTLAVLSLLIWSFTTSWRFPDAWPAALTLGHWLGQLQGGLPIFWRSALLGLLSAGLALVLTLSCLEHEVRFGKRPSNQVLWLLYLPLLVPQISFLLGLQVFLIALRLDGTWPAVVLTHLVFVLPYVFLSLADPWRAYDDRYRQIALCLGASPARVFWRIRLPMLTRAAVTAWAVGFAVSIGQYLPTLLAGGGRFVTITTEAVALSSGGDRRLAAVFGLSQMLLPFLAFVFALALPTLLYRRRRALRL